MERPEPPALTVETLYGIFDRQGWRYSLINGGLLMAFERVLMVLTVDEERETVLVQVPVLPGRGMPGYRRVDPRAEQDACTYLMARNYHLPLGGYARDDLDGEIRFDVAIPCSGTALSDDQIGQAILAAVGAVTRDAGTLPALLNRELSLAQALARIERADAGPYSQVV